MTGISFDLIRGAAGGASGGRDLVSQRGGRDSRFYRCLDTDGLKWMAVEVALEVAVRSSRGRDSNRMAATDVSAQLPAFWPGPCVTHEAGDGGKPNGKWEKRCRRRRKKKKRNLRLIVGRWYEYI